ncbi:MAG: PIN domain-containing protein [Chloroflexi bacterium]|nr:PIN domain-containing protein [Chloroflexota bacterium]
MDASVLLRVALGQPNSLKEWRHIERGVSSALVTTESLRALDRLRLRSGLADSHVAERRSTIMSLISSLEIVGVDATVLDRAAQPMPTELGTLDAIHLATALLWRDMAQSDLVIATHDVALGLGAKAHGFAVVGVGSN